ncbi:NAD(P)-binding protein [Cadophora sp. DSE1049]|nr:NAD(P)-binding protein [Cadophora sp. DSE1049]
MSALNPPSEAELKSGLPNKTVIVTGGSQGIGFAIAQLCVANGATVIIGDINPDSGKNAATELGNNTLFVKCDVSKWNDQLHLFSTALSHSPQKRIDIVVCNAGVNPEMVFFNAPDGKKLLEAQTQVKFNYLADDMDGDDLACPPSTILDINLFGVIYGVKLAVHHMKKSGGGRIIVTGSAASYMGMSPQDIYCASKHAVLGLVRATSQKAELEQNSIAIGLVAPWLTETPMTRCVYPPYTKGSLRSSPTDVAAAVGMLAVRDRAQVNGKAIWVQGQTYTEVEGAVAKCYEGMMKSAD